MHKTFSFIVITIVLLSIFVGCDGEKINSIWRDPKVVSDRIDDDHGWENALHFVAKGDVTIGILNDADALYVRLSTRNHAIQQHLLMAGFTVWFDERGGDNKMYGIRFPLPSEMEEKSNSPDILSKLSQASQGDIEIMQPGKKEFNRIAAAYSAPYGIQCRLGNMGDNFIYELQIPLVRNNLRPYGIAMSQTRTIGIGFESGKIEQQQVAAKGHGGRGSHGGRKGHSGGTSGKPEEDTGNNADDREMMKPINTWLKVNLAAKP